MENKAVYDILIIGAGPIGLTCGIEAQKQGLSYLIIEKGCLVNSIYYYPVNMTFFSTADKIEIGNVPFIAHSDKPTRREALTYYQRVKYAHQLNVNLYEKVINAQKDDSFEIQTTKGKYYAKNLIVATGFYDTPNLMNIKGEDLPKVKHYFDEPHPYADQKVIVVGGGNSAVDVALETFRKGAEVTMVIREPELKEGIKYWVKPDIENRIEEGSIRAFFNAQLLEISEKDVVLQTPQGTQTLENDFVLAMTGYQPDYPLLRQLQIDIQDDIEQTPTYNPETHETNISGLFLAGVVCGGMRTNKWFIENSRDHAEKIIQQIQNCSY